MSRANQIRTSCFLVGLLVLFGGGLQADEGRAQRHAAKRQQQALTRLLKEYRDVKTLDLKAELLEEAIKRGRPFTAGLKRQIEMEGQASLRAYREVFLATIDDAPRIEPASIVDANDKLQLHRDHLLLLREWADRLAEEIAAPKVMPAVSDDDTELSAADQLRQREEAFVNEWLNAKGLGRITSIEATLIQQVNRYRVEKKLPRLEVDFKLCAAARDHSLDMTVERFFSHKSELRHKLTFVGRAVRFGTTARRENIANCPTPEMVVPMWKASSGHDRAMLDPHSQRVGVGHIGRKYTMMFGAGPVAKAEKQVAERE